MQPDRRRCATALLAALIFLLCTPQIVRAAATDGAGSFVAGLTDRAMVQLTEPGLAETEQKLRFRALFNEAFDLAAIGRFVLGRYWRRADPAQRSDFLGAFEDMMIYRFLPLFSLYSGEKFDIGAIRPHKNNPDFVSVETKLRRAEGEPIQVNWRVRKHGGGYKIVDIVAEGVSIAVTLRSEYVSVLKRNGGDVEALTQVLREKAKGL
jgi:phospholipid transport system substrate-binding protein